MSGPAHGTRARYQAGCRCGGCTEANRAYSREYARRHYRSRRRDRAVPDEEYLCDECGRVLRGRWRDAEYVVVAFELGRRHTTRFVFCSADHEARFRRRVRSIPVLVYPPGETVPPASAPTASGA